MRARTPWLVALVLALAGLATWRASCVIAGPDIDTDAYAHHMIARAILMAPRDLAVHWVWLPLFHYAQVPVIACGMSMNFLRWMNVALAAALPVVLFAYVHRTVRTVHAPMSADCVALLAALFAAACPIAMQMGTTAQPEPLFALLVLGVAVAFERRSHRAAAGMLSAAVMLRYEAWAVLVVAAGSLVIELWTGRGRPAKESARGSCHGDDQVLRRTWLRWVVVAAPTLLILLWAALRRPVDGQWFGFLRQTREFADSALQGRSTGKQGLLGPLSDFLYYPIAVPLRVLGPAMALAPFGVLRTIREQGARFVLVFLACLGFVSLSWVTRSSLGLDRHFVAVVPLYSTFAAQGAAVVADWTMRGARQWGRSELVSMRTGRAVGYALALASLMGLGMVLHTWMGFWRASIARGWPERAALGAYLRSLAGAPIIFCDDATLEIESGLDWRRFDRHWVDDPHTWTLIDDVARGQGAVYIATWRRKLRGHEGAGEIVFRAGFDPDNPEATGVAVMRVRCR